MSGGIFIFRILIIFKKNIPNIEAIPYKYNKPYGNRWLRLFPTFSQLQKHLLKILDYTVVTSQRDE